MLSAGKRRDRALIEPDRSALVGNGHLCQRTSFLGAAVHARSVCREPMPGISLSDKPEGNMSRLTNHANQWPEDMCRGVAGVGAGAPFEGQALPEEDGQ
jgi:hypothetical protein